MTATTSRILPDLSRGRIALVKVRIPLDRPAALLAAAECELCYCKLQWRGLRGLPSYDPARRRCQARIAAVRRSLPWLRRAVEWRELTHATSR